MQDSLIHTKLHLPFLRAQLAPRQRLQARVSQGLAGPLTLITAPAGFGKTLNTIVTGGRVVGQWRRSLEKKSVRVAIAPFIQLNARQEAALTEAAERYADFLGLMLVV